MTGAKRDNETFEDIRKVYDDFEATTFNEANKSKRILLSPVSERAASMDPAQALSVFNDGVWLQEEKAAPFDNLMQHNIMVAQIFIAKGETWYHFVSKATMPEIEKHYHQYLKTLDSPI